MTARRLGSGFLHLQDGPIDLVIAAEGPGSTTAEHAACSAFDGMLSRLVEELAVLRRPIDGPRPTVDHPIARRMIDAVWRHRDTFVTPMAAVAGAVADDILAAMITAAPGLRRAWVNNGGDISLHLGAGERFEVGLVRRPDTPELAGRATVAATGPVRGIATSGRHGRSLSLGIADAVTVLAADAASADVAATLIANAVDLPEHPSIRRVPAHDEDPDSDLGDRMVVRAVGPISSSETAAALAPGETLASRMAADRRIYAAAICLGDQWRFAGRLDNSALLSPSQAPRR